MTEEFNDEKQGISSWIQDNLRIIISIFIVILIAGSIFSYSKRGDENVAINDQGATEEEMLQEILSDNNEAEEIANEEAESASSEEIESAENESAEEIVQDAQKDEQIQEEEPADQAEVAENEEAESENETAEETSDTKQEISATQDAGQETEGSFVETANAGEGLTHLARKSLNDYLEKNPDSSLTPEHKVYVEDYLRKKVGFQGRVHVGTSVEFSKSLIQEAIESSKKLSDSQLKNLEKYSALVS